MGPRIGLPGVRLPAIQGIAAVNASPRSKWSWRTNAKMKADGMLAERDTVLLAQPRADRFGLRRSAARILRARHNP